MRRLEMSGFLKSVYVLESNGLLKIGVSKNVDARVLSLKTGNPDIKILYISKKLSNAQKIESKLHKTFCNFKVYSEWFYGISASQVIKTTEKLVTEIGRETETEKEKGSGSLSVITNKLFGPVREKIRELDQEIEEIKQKNEVLMQQLLESGWDESDLKELIAEAEKTVERRIGK